MHHQVELIKEKTFCPELAEKGSIIYATNQELPRSISKETLVRSITQDCSSNKTKIIKHGSPYLEKQH